MLENIKPREHFAALIKISKLQRIQISYKKYIKNITELVQIQQPPGKRGTKNADRQTFFVAVFLVMTNKKAQSVMNVMIFNYVLHLMYSRK